MPTDSPSPVTTTNALATAMLAIKAEIPRDADFKMKGAVVYKYASVDSVYTAIRRHLADAGLTVFQDEIESEIIQVQSRNGAVANIKATYRMGFQTDPTKAPDVLETFSLTVPLNGPQSFGAIRSYALKYWLRAKLLLATGDADDEVEDARQIGEIAPDAPPGAWFMDQETGGMYDEGQWDEPINKALALFTFTMEKVFVAKARYTPNEKERYQKLFDANVALFKRVFAKPQITAIGSRLAKMGVDMKGQDQ